MSKINNGGPAFPVYADINVPMLRGDDVKQKVMYPGMTLRAWFAGKAMDGLLAYNRVDLEYLGALAKEAVRLADAIIAELEEGK